MKTMVIQSGKGGAAGRRSLGRFRTTIDIGRLIVVSAHVLLEVVPTAGSLTGEAKCAIES